MPEEHYQEWLDRLEIPIEAQATIDDFIDYLAEELEYNDDQINALADAFTAERDFERLGIRAVTVTYPHGKELRYGILGSPGGLWGFESAMKFAAERVGEEEYWTERMIERGLLR